MEWGWGEWEHSLFLMLGLVLVFATVTAITAYCVRRLASAVWKTARGRWMVVSVVEAGSRFKLSIWLCTRPYCLILLTYLLTDCLDPHNFKAIQRKAILALNRLITDRLRKYAAITEPTETEVCSLNATTLAFSEFCLYIQPEYLDHIQEILPVIVSIFKEPGNRKEAQMNSASALGHLAYSSLEAANLLNDSGVMKMLVDTLRDGIEDKTIIRHALRGFYNTVWLGPQMIQPALDMGAIDAIHEVLKRPNDGCDKYPSQQRKPWYYATGVLFLLAEGTDDQREAILSKDGLLELVLKRGREVTEISEQTFWHHWRTARLVATLLVLGSDGQVRRLMYNTVLLGLIGRYLNADDPGYSLSEEYSIHHRCLEAVQAICEVPVSATNRRIRRLLFDDTGITDDIHRLTIFSPFSPTPLCVQNKLLVISIFDTYFKDPLPPLPPSKLPPIIYTKNYPYDIPQ